MVKDLAVGENFATIAIDSFRPEFIAFVEEEIFVAVVNAEKVCCARIGQESQAKVVEEDRIRAESVRDMGKGQGVGEVGGGHPLAKESIGGIAAHHEGGNREGRGASALIIVGGEKIICRDSGGPSNGYAVRGEDAREIDLQLRAQIHESGFCGGAGICGHEIIERPAPVGSHGRRSFSGAFIAGVLIHQHIIAAGAKELPHDLKALGSMTIPVRLL